MGAWNIPRKLFVSRSDEKQRLLYNGWGSFEYEGNSKNGS